MAPARKARRQMSGSSSPCYSYSSEDGFLEDLAGHLLLPESQLLMTPISTPHPSTHDLLSHRTPPEFPFPPTLVSKEASKKPAIMADQKPFRRRKPAWPWSRRVNIWDPPTALDLVLDSPLRALISFIYAFLLSLRGAPFKPPRNKPKVRAVCISDTHTNTPHIPDGDLLIHAGDISNAGTVQEIQAQIDWLDSLPHKEKIIIAGNHDSYFDSKSRRLEDKGKRLNLKSLHYLQNNSVELKFKGGRKLKFYGSPDVPQCGGSDFAFQYNRTTAPWENRIPKDTDVLITHSPPRYHLDLNLGCAGLLEEIWKVRPRLHIFGHIHSGHGRQAVFWDEGQRAYERLMARKKGGVIADIIPNMGWIDALKVMFYGFTGIFWDRLMVGPRGGTGGLMVNASLVYQSTTDIGNPVEIVEL